MLSIDENLEYQANAAATKLAFTRRPVAYTVQSMLAGSYIGVAVMLMVSAAGPLQAAGSPATRLVQGLVFGVALTLVYTAGGELVTSTMMTMTQGAWKRTVSWLHAGRTIIFCFFGNMAGAFVFAAMLHFTGLLETSTPAGSMLASMLEAKGGETSAELFWRGVLCNMLVCIAMWSASRLKSEMARLVTIFWCLLAFITSGFEHVVANMTSFGVGLIAGLPQTDWADFARNMTVVGLGNLVGGAVVVGLAYAVSASRRTAAIVAAPAAPGSAPAAPVAAPAAQATASIDTTTSPVEWHENADATSVAWSCANFSPVTRNDDGTRDLTRTEHAEV
ncbi:formate/nitrite transporter family protein [Sanguibacter sp. A247]|uniref:formate/nitrite transporter family protein n=1 Tax=unclassified Sanguibacter TaxID=2645534 RepID=UPI003FD824D3